MKFFKIVFGTNISNKTRRQLAIKLFISVNVFSALRGTSEMCIKIKKKHQ